jgi:GntR family transcriptional regulator/MocR family aminotransferase
MAQVLTTLLQVEKNGKLPIYLQLANQLTALIRAGTLQPGYRLLSTRQLATALKVHRRTVVEAYDELLAQGWLESRTGNGTFVARHIPEIKLVKLFGETDQKSPQQKAGFKFEVTPQLDRPVLKPVAKIHFDDGFPDTRLAPLEELARSYRSQMLNGDSYVRLGYGDTKGSAWLRQELSVHLNETRGMKTTAENILIVRGVVMGVHLASQGLLKPGDRVVCDEAGWFGANMNFEQAGAKVLQAPVDEHGVDMDALETICEMGPVRMVYLTSHHHYPTTVALRADRRIRLLKLSEKYGFIIFEDDYDYDFHYLSKPFLPLAGADTAGMVLYCGSFTKTISPAFRVGYLVGPEDVITHLAQMRRIIDRQGDVILENAMAELLREGIIQRHLRKSVRIYKQRRDVFCDLLKNSLGNYVDFQVPDGGMAVWVKFDQRIDLKELASAALKKDLYFGDGSMQGNLAKFNNASRLGFASSNSEELEEGVRIMKQLLEKTGI